MATIVNEGEGTLEGISCLYDDMIKGMKVISRHGRRDRSWQS